MDVIGEDDIDRDTLDAARDLAECLGESYEGALARLLDEQVVPDNPSMQVREFLRSRDMDKPRITTYTHKAFERMMMGKLATYSDQDHAKHDKWMQWASHEYGDESAVMPEHGYIPHKSVRESAPDSAIVNFQLPKPLDVFWAKEHGEEPASWGALYRRLADIPWVIIREWLQEYGDEYTVDRLNPVGIHGNGDDGFYYLFEVSPLRAPAVSHE